MTWEDISIGTVFLIANIDKPDDKSCHFEIVKLSNNEFVERRVEDDFREVGGKINIKHIRYNKQFSDWYFIADYINDDIQIYKNTSCDCDRYYRILGMKRDKCF